jgi:hypothetical protein
MISWLGLPTFFRVLAADPDIKFHTPSHSADTSTTKMGFPTRPLLEIHSALLLPFRPSFFLRFRPAGGLRDDNVMRDDDITAHSILIYHHRPLPVSLPAGKAAWTKSKSRKERGKGKKSGTGILDDVDPSPRRISDVPHFARHHPHRTMSTSLRVGASVLNWASLGQMRRAHIDPAHLPTLLSLLLRKA